MPATPLSNAIDVNARLHRYLGLWLLIALSVYVSSIYFYMGSESAHRKIYYIAIVLPFFVFVAWRPSFLRTLKHSRIMLLTLTMACLAVASVFYGDRYNLTEDLYDGVRYGLLILLLMALFSYLAVIDKRYPTYFVAVVGLASAVSAAHFTTQYFIDMGRIAIGPRMDMGIGYASHTIRMAELFAVGALAALAQWSRSTDHRMQTLWLGCVALSVGPMLLAQSRGPLLALVCAATAMCCLQRRWWTIASVMGIAVGMGAILLLLDIGYRDFSTVSSINVRFAIWKGAISDILQNPVLGVGWIDMANISTEVRGRFHQTHNIYLSVLLQGGVIGFIVFLALLVRGLFVGATKLDSAPEFAAGFLILVFFTVNGLVMTRWIYDNPALAWLQFWIPLGLLVIGELNDRRRAGESEGDVGRVDQDRL